MSSGLKASAALARRIGRSPAPASMPAARAWGVDTAGRRRPLRPARQPKARRARAPDDRDRRALRDLAPPARVSIRRRRSSIAAALSLGLGDAADRPRAIFARDQRPRRRGARSPASAAAVAASRPVERRVPMRQAAGRRACQRGGRIRRRAGRRAIFARRTASRRSRAMICSSTRRSIPATSASAALPLRRASLSGAALGRRLRRRLGGALLRRGGDWRLGAVGRRPRLACFRRGAFLGRAPPMFEMPAVRPALGFPNRVSPRFCNRSRLFGGSLLSNIHCVVSLFDCRRYRDATRTAARRCGSPSHRRRSPRQAQTRRAAARFRSPARIRTAVKTYSK